MSPTIAGLVAIVSAVVTVGVLLFKRPMGGCKCGRCHRSQTTELRCVVPPGCHAWLEFRNGPMGGNSVQLTERHTLIGSVAPSGNAPGLIVLSDPAVSEEHARIDRKNGTFALRDLGSTNGVFVNGRRRLRATLASDDILIIGNSELVFRFI